MTYNNEHHRNQDPQPKFNMNIPFCGIVTATVNYEMSLELQNFVADFDDVEEPIAAFAAALRDHTKADDQTQVDDPRGQAPCDYDDGEVAFRVTPSFKGVVVIQLNNPMRDLLIDFISEIEGGVEKLIWAFRLALENPLGVRPSNRRSNYGGGNGNHGGNHGGGGYNSRRRQSSYRGRGSHRRNDQRNDYIESVPAGGGQ